MTNHIEELMKAAGVKLVIRYYLYFINEEMEITKEALIRCAKAFTNLGKVTRVTREYPAFTPEKQLELIKLIGTYGNICICKRNYNDNWCITNHFKNGIGESTVFEEALAKFLINVIEKISKSEVKKILED